MESGIRSLTSTDLNTSTIAKTESYGAAGVTSDGKRYRYIAAGNALTSGNLVIAPALVANHQNISVAAAVPANAVSLTVTLGATAATADQYADGTLVIGVAGSGTPLTLRVRGNTAAASGGVATIYFYQSSPVLYALTTSNVVSLAASLFNGVQASTTAGYPVGVAASTIAAGSFGWVQVYGPVGVVNDAAGTIAALGKIKQSLTVAGAVVVSTVATDIQVGSQLQSTAASTAGLAVISLD